jgi:hypothetical protein
MVSNGVTYSLGPKGSVFKWFKEGNIYRGNVRSECICSKDTGTVYNGRPVQYYRGGILCYPNCPSLVFIARSEGSSLGGRMTLSIFYKGEASNFADKGMEMTG